MTDAAQVGTRSVLFTDLVGSTEMRVRLGEEGADELRRAHDALLTEAVTSHNGVVVKGLGDGILATFESAADAVAAAVAIQQAVYRQDFEVRVGLSIGDISAEGDDVYGVPVVEASRLCDTAAGGEILAAELIRALARGRGGFVFESMGDLELKGLPEPVPSTRVIWEPLVDTGTGDTEPGEVPVPAALLIGISAAYVGRPQLLDQLDEHWRRVTDGSTRTVLLAGEPGVGKTRTAAEMARRVHQQNGLVLYGRCDEGLGAPYQPFVEALDWYTTHVPQGPVLGRLPGELTRLLPDLAHRVPGLPQPTASDPGSEEHRLFEATTSWLIDLAQSTPTLLVLDDLHWATKPTLLLTLHLLRAASELRAPLMVLVTYRDTDIDRAHPLSGLLGDLRRLPGVERTAVDNLSQDEVLKLMEAAAGHQMDDAGTLLAGVVFAETEGNPFFVTEVLRHLVETGAIKREGERFVPGIEIDQLSIPEGVRDVIGRRLSRLSSETNDVLSIGSALGRELDVDVLMALADGGEDVVLDALDESVRARLVEETGVDHFRFAHALVRTTLYEELTATRRRRLHRRIADAIEKLRPEDYVALAYHCAEGGPEGGDISRALRYGLAAAEQSLASRAFADAEQRFLAVLDLLEDAEEADPPERVAALVGLGEAQRDQGNPDFRETLLDAGRRAQELGLTEWLVRAALSNSRGLVSIVGGIDPERIAITETALDAIGPEPTANRARLMAQLAAEVTFAGDHERRIALSDEAEAIARETDDPHALSWVIARMGYASMAPSRWEGLIDVTEEAIRAADDSGDPTQRVLVRAYRGSLLMFAGRVLEADALLGEARDIATADASPNVQWAASGYSIRLAFHDGVDEYERRNNELLMFGQGMGQADALQWWAAMQLALTFSKGEEADVVDAVGVFADEYVLSKPWRSGHAWVLATSGRVDEARAIVERERYTTNLMEDDPLPLAGPFQLGWLAYELGDQELAAAVISVLSRYRGRWPHYYVATFGPVESALGVAKATLGELDEAIELLSGAIDDMLAASFDVLAARMRIDLAEILLKRGGPGDRDRAVAELETSRARALVMKAPRLVARIDAVRASMS